MARIKFKMPTVSRTTRLRRARNAQEDREALNRLELAERQWNIPNELRTEFTASVNNRHDTFDDHREETGQFPGLEDDSEDGEDHPRPANKWVNLEEDEVLDDIDLMVQMSNERYWQRARDFNWNILMGPLHGAYMVQKSLTDDWSGSNSYSDFQNSKPCNCGPRSKHSRYVDLVDIHYQERTLVEFCQCTLDPVRLLRLGYLAGSPVTPQTAFSVPLLIFHNSMWNHCHVGALPFTQALASFLEPRSNILYARRKQHRCDLRKPFSAAVDLYRRLEEMTEKITHSVLKLNNRQILASLSCPACFGPQPLDTSCYPETTRDRLIVCLDGNFQHRHHSKASRNHQPLRTPRIFLSQTDIDKAKCEIRDKELDNNTPEQVDRCTESHKAADDKRNEATWKGCDDTGLMGCCCRHDAAIYKANIYKSGEQRCFPLAIIKQLMSDVEPNQPVGILYDIGCSLDKFVDLRKLLVKDRSRIRFGTSVFHAYVHNWTCQLKYHPRFNKGWGLSDGEGLERLWLYMSPLISSLRYSTRNHCFGSVSHCLAHHNRRGILKLLYWLRQKFIKAVQRQRETNLALTALLQKTNPHSSSGRNYTESFFWRQWLEQQAFQADHTDLEEMRMKKMAALYQRENVIDLMRNRLRNPRIFLASELEVRELIDSIETESRKLQEEMEQLSAENIPAENVEERKMRLLLWHAKSELFVQAVHLRAERQPLLDAKHTGSRLGTKFKEKVFKAINARRPALVKLITAYNDEYSKYKLKYPNRLGSNVQEDDLLTYEKLSTMPLDDAFWNDGLFYHSDAPWAIDPNVREGIHCVLVLSRVQEEFELIAQELVCAMSWAIEFHDTLVNSLAYMGERISVLKVGDPEVAADHIDEQKLTGVTRRDSVKVIRNEVNRQLLLHCELVKGWSEDVTWLWQHCQPAQNAAFLDTWNKFVDQIRKVRLGGSSNDTERTDDALEDAVLDELVDDGEDLDNADDGSVFQTNSTA